MNARPTDVDLDLKTGGFTLREGKAGASEVPRTEGRISEAALQRVRAAAMSALQRGFETRACRVERRSGALILPIMDATVSMILHLDGKSAAAPIRPDCWSKAANALEETADRAVHQRRDGTAPPQP